MVKQTSQKVTNQYQQKAQETYMFDPFTGPIISAIAKGGIELIKSSGVLKTKNPLFVSILESYLRESKHNVRVRIQNLSLHGIYLENLVIEAGPNWRGGNSTIENLEFYEFEQTHVGLLDKSSVLLDNEQIFPKLIYPKDSVHIGILFPLIDEDSAINSPYCKVKIDFSKLDKINKETLEIECRLRWKPINISVE